MQSKEKISLERPYCVLYAEALGTGAVELCRISDTKNSLANLLGIGVSGRVSASYITCTTYQKEQLILR